MHPRYKTKLTAIGIGLLLVLIALTNTDPPREPASFGDQPHPQHHFHVVSARNISSHQAGRHVSRPAKNSDADMLTDRGSAEGALKGLASQIKKNKQSCIGRFRGPIRQKARFSNGTSFGNIIQQLSIEYCQLAPTMEAQNISAPLFVHAGAVDATLATFAANQGCRSAILTHYKPFFDRIQSDNTLHPNTTIQFQFPHSTGATIKTSAEYPDLSQPKAAEGEDFALGKFKFSKAPYESVEVAGRGLGDLLEAETLVPILVLNGGGMELPILEETMDLIDNHRVQSLVFNLWPALMRQHTKGSLQGKVQMLANHLHRRGYHLYYSSIASFHGLSVPQLPSTPECPADLVDFLDFSTSFDASGLFTFVVAVKT